MSEFEFTLILKADPDEDTADALYAIFTDGTISTISGLPQIRFHREAKSLVEAIRSAIRDVQSAKVEVERIEVHPETVLQTT